MDCITLSTSPESILTAILLTGVAGMATAIGAALALRGREPNPRFIAFSLGLSAGVMIYISLVELLPEAGANFARSLGGKDGMALAAVAFFAGMGLIALIDKWVPEDENPHEPHTMAEFGHASHHHLKRTGPMLAFAIAIHNFPEGIATFISALEGVSVALPIIAAIAIHNIPEGVAVAVPIYASTGNRRRAMKYSILAGLAEPLGAVVGGMLLLPFWTPALAAVCLASTAGIMVYISFDELLPSAESHGHHHLSVGGVIVGMFIMALSLWLL